MSSIDRRIVEMKFDNGDFSKKTKETVRDLESLEKALKLEAAGNGLEQLDSKARGLSLNSVGTAVDNISNRFSLLGTIGTGALMAIGDKAVSVGASLAQNIMEPLFGGGKRRALNLENADFTLKGLGSSLNDMREALDWAVLDTSFGLDAAAKASSMIYASGYKSIDEQKIILRGISGVAAMTNSSYEEISDVMTKVAGQGRLMGDDLNRLANRGLNVAATMAEAYGVTEAELREMVTEGAVSFMDFATVMDAHYGEHAKKANDTMTGAVANFKAAWSRIGAQFFTPYHEAIRNLANGFKPLIDIIAKGVAPVMTMLGETMIKGSEKVQEYLSRFTDNQEYYDTLWNTANNIMHIFKALGDVIRGVVMPIFKGLFGYLWQGDLPFFEGIELGIFAIREFIEALIPSVETMGKLERIGAAVAAVFSLMWDILFGLVSSLWNVRTSAENLDTGFLSLVATIADFIVMVVDAVKNSGALQLIFEKVAKLAGWIGIAFKYTMEATRRLWEWLGDVGAIDTVVSAFSTLVDWLKTVRSWFAELTIVQAVSGWFKSLGDHVSSAVDWTRQARLIGYVVRAFQTLVGWLKTAYGWFRELGIIDAVSGWFRNLGEWGKRAFNWISDAAAPAIQLIRDFFSDTENLKQAWADFVEFLAPVWDFITEGLSRIGDGAKDAFDAFKDAMSRGSSFAGSWVEALRAFLQPVANWDVSGLASSAATAVKDFLKAFLDGISAGSSAVWDGLAVAFGGIGKFSQNVYKWIKDALGGVSSDDVNDLINKSIIGVFSVSFYKFADGWQKFGGSFASIAASIGGYFKTLSASIKANNLLTIAAAIAMLAASIWLISKIPQEDLIPAVAVIGGLMLVMTLLSSTMGKMSARLEGVSFAKILVAFGAILGIIFLIGMITKELAQAMAPLNDAQIIGMGAVLLLVTILIHQIGKTLTTMTRELFSTPSEFAALLAVTVAVTAIMAGIALMLHTLTPLANSPIGGIVAAIAGVTIMVLAIGYMLKELAKTTKDVGEASMVFAAGAIWVVMAGLTRLVDSLVPLASAPIAGIIAATLSLVPLIVAIGVVINDVANVKGIDDAVKVLAAGASIWLVLDGLGRMAENLAPLASMPMSGILAATLAMIPIIITVGLLIHSLSRIKDPIDVVSLLSASGSMWLVLDGLGRLASGLAPLANAPIGGIAVSLGMLIVVLVALGGVLAVLATITDPIDALVILASGGAMWLVLEGLSRLSTAVAPLAEAPPAGVVAALGMLSVVILAIGGVFIVLAMIPNPIAALTIIAAGAAIWLVMDGLVRLAGAIQTVTAIPLGDAYAALGVLGVALVGVGAILAILGLFPQAVIGGGAIWLAGGGLLSIATAISEFAAMDMSAAEIAAANMKVVVSDIFDAVAGENGLSALSAVLGGTALNVAIKPLQELPAALRKWEDIKANPEIENALQTIQRGIEPFGVGDIFGGIAAGITNGVLTDLPAILRNWEGIVANPEIENALKSIQRGIEPFGVGDIFGGIAAGLTSGALTDLPDAIRKWEGITVEPNIELGLQSLARGISAFSLGNAFDAIAAAITSGAISNLPDAIRKWDGVTVSETIETGLKSLAAGITAFGGVSGILSAWAANNASDALSSLATAMGKWQGISIPGNIEASLTGLANGVKAFDAGLWNNHGDATRAATALTELRDAAKGWPSNLGTLGGQLTQLATGLNNLNDASTLSTFSSSLTTSLSAIQTKLNTSGINLATSLLSGFKSKQSEANPIGKDYGEKVAGGLAASRATINTKARDAVSGIADAITGKLSGQSTSIYIAAYSLGSNLGRGLVNGMESKRSSITSTAASLARSATTAIGGRYGWSVASPSKKGIWLGNMLSLGLADGIADKANKVTSAAQGTAMAALDELSAVFAHPREYGLDGLAPVITPVLDTRALERRANGISQLFNGVNASVDANAARATGLALNQNGAAQNAAAVSSATYHYEQIINSPKAIDNAEIYRRTKSLVEIAKKKGK